MTRLVKMITGKPVNRFPTGNRFSECITGFRIYRTSQRLDPGNADGGVYLGALGTPALVWVHTHIALPWVPSPTVFSQFQRNRIHILVRH